MRDRLADFQNRLPETKIDLGSTESLPSGYEAGHALGRKFRSDELKPEVLENALHVALDAYQKLIDRGGLVPSDVMSDQAGTNDIEESRKYTLSRRIERSRNVRGAVLSSIKPICQGCGLDPIKDYGFKGKPVETPLDVHHLIPLFELAEGETKRYRVPEDFAVLCPTCHRVIHKQGDPNDIQQLKKTVRFRHMRELL